MEDPLKYRLITGKDDSCFCKKNSNYLEEGCELHGSPSVTFNGKDVIAVRVPE